MRKSCFDCVRKHLGSAAVFVKECKMGYPSYDIFVIGELEHAADECLEEHPDLAKVIREHRLAWMEDPDHRIPFETLNEYIKVCTMASKQGIAYPEMPNGVFGNLDPAHFHGDTRP